MRNAMSSYLVAWGSEKSLDRQATSEYLSIDSTLRHFIAMSKVKHYESLHCSGRNKETAMEFCDAPTTIPPTFNCSILTSSTRPSILPAILIPHVRQLLDSVSPRPVATILLRLLVYKARQLLLMPSPLNWPESRIALATGCVCEGKDTRIDPIDRK